MGIAVLYDIAIFLLIIVAIAVIVIMLMFLMSKRKGDLTSQCMRARDDVRSFRQQRLVLIEQALAMFSAGNKYADSLSKLAEIYRTIDNEKKEILWEEKYIKIMKRFLAQAKKDAPANMMDAWKMLNSAVNENEDSLDKAREAYVSFKPSLSQFDNPPQSYIIAASDKLTSGIKRLSAAKREFDAQMEKSRANGDEKGTASVSSNNGSEGDSARRARSYSANKAHDARDRRHRKDAENE